MKALILSAFLITCVAGTANSGPLQSSHHPGGGASTSAEQAGSTLGSVIIRTGTLAFIRVNMATSAKARTASLARKFPSIAQDMVGMAMPIAGMIIIPIAPLATKMTAKIPAR